jgi:hypothetical protein
LKQERCNEKSCPPGQRNIQPAEMPEAVLRHLEFLLGNVDQDHKPLSDLAGDQLEEKHALDCIAATGCTLVENILPVQRADQCLGFCNVITIASERTCKVIDSNK